MQLLDVGLVEIDLGDRASDLGVREHAGQLTLRQKTLDLFEFLQFDYGHWFAFASARTRLKPRVPVA